MSIDDQNKVKEARFTILRKDDYPVPRIKVSTGRNGGWKTYAKYTTKAARDKAFRSLMNDDKTISD